MPYERTGGKQCVVIGCTNSQKKVFDWKNSICIEHEVEHIDCPCLPPFKFHCIPADADKRRLWIKSINRKEFNPASKSLVCSIHFKDGKPTKENPIPVLNMGYIVTTDTPARRPLIRRSLNLNVTPLPKKQLAVPSTPHLPQLDFESMGKLVATPMHQEMNNSAQGMCDTTCCYLNPKYCYNKVTLVDACTQTLDEVLLDHSYLYSKKTRSVKCQQPVSEFSMENVTTDFNARFYTGLSLVVLCSLVNTLKDYGKKTSL